MPKVSDLFTVRYGVNLELNALKIDPNGVAFVSRTELNNGISGRVLPVDGCEPIPAGTISVACGGSVMASFLQTEPYYSGRDLFYLTARVEMTDAQKLYYCACLRANRFRYNYGRQANRTLGDITLPALAELPEWVQAARPAQFDGKDRRAVSEPTPTLDTTDWVPFRYDQVFEIRKGYYNKKPPTCDPDGAIPFIGATERANGITAWVSPDAVQSCDRNGPGSADPVSRKIFKAPCITVSNNGSVGEAFYQPLDFTCSHDVNPLYLKDGGVHLTPGIAFFLATVIRAEKYRWNYGRKWRPMRMPSSVIRLPVDAAGKPDWAFMERYVATLPFSEVATSVPSPALSQIV